MKRRYMFDNPGMDRRLRKLWAVMEKKSPFKGMTTQQIMDWLHKS